MAEATAVQEAPSQTEPSSTPEPVISEAPLTPEQELKNLTEERWQLGQKAIDKGLNALTPKELARREELEELHKRNIFNKTRPVEDRYRDLEAVRAEQAKETQPPEWTDDERQNHADRYQYLSRKESKDGLDSLSQQERDDLVMYKKLASKYNVFSQKLGLEEQADPAFRKSAA